MYVNNVTSLWVDVKHPLTFISPRTNLWVFQSNRLYNDVEMTQNPPLALFSLKI